LIFKFIVFIFNFFVGSRSEKRHHRALDRHNQASSIEERSLRGSSNSRSKSDKMKKEVTQSIEGIFELQTKQT